MRGRLRGDWPSQSPWLSGHSKPTTDEQVMHTSSGKRRTPAMRSVLATLAALIALALVVAACGGGTALPKSSSSAAGTPVFPQPGASASPKTTPKPSDNPIVQAAPTKDPPTQRSGPCVPRVEYTKAVGEPGSNYIRAKPQSQTKWGPKCNPLNSRTSCVIPWDGVYQVLDSRAHLTFQAWVPGRDTPVHEKRLGPLPDGNQFRGYGFPFAVPSAKEVAFRLVLENSVKVAVAISDAFVYKIDCRAPLPSPTS